MINQNGPTGLRSCYDSIDKVTQAAASAVREVFSGFGSFFFHLSQKKAYILHHLGIVSYHPSLWQVAPMFVGYQFLTMMKSAGLFDSWHLQAAWYLHHHLEMVADHSQRWQVAPILVGCQFLAMLQIAGLFDSWHLEIVVQIAQ
ncbi:MAG TPA: hypothetical protein PK178_12040 [Smithellaceae bacterium]|nr:hypothetical protein [Smithellaceae bacterium]